MKKGWVVCALLSVILLLGGCASSAVPPPEAGAGSYVQARPTAVPDAESAEKPAGIPPVTLPEVPDIDLTGLSYPMVYAQVYDIAVAPTKHVGKTLRIQGLYVGAEYPELGEAVHSILVADEAGCCGVGLEFTVTGSPAWPEDYPPNYSPIALTGVLGTITAGEAVYALLTVNSIEVMDSPGL